IRDWEEWLRATHPDHEATAEARYYLAVILAGTPGEERASLEILRDVAAGGGERSADALWRIAWIERRLGADAAARSALDRLLEAQTGAGYRTAALYWRARFAAPAERDRAIELYRAVRREAPRDYYARAAEDRLRELGQEPSALVADGAALPAPDSLADLGRRPEPAYGRGVELAALGLPRLAAAELATLDLAADPALALGIAHLHHRGGDTWSAIGLLLEHFADELAGLPLDAPGVAPEVWETLYPFPYEPTVRSGIRSANLVPPGVPIDPWLVATVARRESRFWRHAASPAGAVGVLQLMPETAARVARQVGMAPPDRPALFDAETNLALGTAELARLIAAFDGEWAPALAAYNAGEAAAREWWQARPPGQPLDEWIENIPYTETRLYVKWILGTYPIYRHLHR
ncbi:MAG TPA: transglycosylase SLT domain-containing protein, partial [Thermoanaerobaculia bacterium]|nr:transglycosylase SLT domain-containing protein [Thermoanaerobaculia bacterium]